ncbi:MAG: MFS transporter, partial [Dehalococcoidia bacterium]|nr:MFS transporter [Dehalococcoidia bacterium]
VKEEAVDVSRMIARGVEYAAEVQEVEFTLKQTMRTSAYWLLTLASSAMGMWAGIMNLHSIPFLTDMGIDPLRAAVMIGMASAVMIPARLISGFIVDRIKKGHIRFMKAGAYFLQAVGATLFLLNPTIAMIYVWYILYWLGQGITVPLNSLIMARYYGRKAFGSIQGFSNTLTAPVGIIAPVYAGWLYDTTGSYITAFRLLVGLMVISAVIMVFASPPKPPAEITDIRKII